MTSVIQNRSVESYFTCVDKFSTAFLVYGEAPYGEHNTMFTGYTYGKPSFGKKNYLQFLKEMDSETIKAAHDCFANGTPVKKQTAKATKKFVEQWHRRFNENLHSPFINPDFLEGRTGASQIHCKVKFPVTKEERTYVFDVAKGAVLTKGVLLYAYTIALQMMTEGDEEKVAILESVKYNGCSIAKYFYNEDSEDYDNVAVVRCEFKLSPVGS
jgi:hypothetical protein